VDIIVKELDNLSHSNPFWKEVAKMAKLMLKKYTVSRNMHCVGMEDYICFGKGGIVEVLIYDLSINK